MAQQFLMVYFTESNFNRVSEAFYGIHGKVHTCPSLYVYANHSQDLLWIAVPENMNYPNRLAEASHIDFEQNL
jgi:hypothetical protein